MKIACLYFPTSSVGGIATNVANLRTEAQRRGDTFHVLVCANVKAHLFSTFKESKRIRGGDTFIDIDGYASHHPDRQKYSAQKLNEYDLIYLAFLCPHPTKAYGDKPVFLPLLQGLTKPIVGHITDGYFDSYAEWGNQVIPLCKRIVVDQEAYLPEGFKERFPDMPVVFGRSIDPAPVSGIPRSTERSLVWIAQWKAIKGIHQLLHLLPKIEGRQDLYSNGIMYYQKRTEPEWAAAIGVDEFQGHSGQGKATFYGWQPPNVIREALCRTWFMPEFQGLGKPRNRAYHNGSLNHTITEALFYECTPVIPQMTIDALGIPPESAIGIKDYGECVAALNGPRATRPDLGKQWVLDTFPANKTYDNFFGELC